MGIVVDPERARRDLCECILIGKDPDDPQDRMCFTKGIIGTLTDQQEREFCPSPLFTRQPSPQMQERLRRFRLIGRIMEACLGEQEKDFAGCVKREAEKL